MKKQKGSWGIVSFVVLATILVVIFTGEETSSQKARDARPFQDRNKYAVANYDDIGPSDVKALNEKKRKDKRYDKRPFVAGKVYPGEDLVLSFDAEPIPPAIPAGVSSLIVIGQIETSKAFITQDQGAVYSEFSIQVESVLKNDEKGDWVKGKPLTADRRGGIVRYPDGQEVLYLLDWADMPETGESYLLFLSHEDDDSSNYKILTGYKLKNDKVGPLDNHAEFRKFDRLRVEEFITRVQAEVKGEVEGNEYPHHANSSAFDTLRLCDLSDAPILSRFVKSSNLFLYKSAASYQ